MLKSLFVYGVLGVLLIPAKGDKISVCIEDDQDLRVDCLLEPVPNKISSYEFSWSSGNKESTINTNVSGLSQGSEFKGKSTVQGLTPHGYRMTLPNFTDKLSDNSTFLCKVSGVIAKVAVEKDKIPTCSAVSLFLRSPITWFIGLLLFLYETQS